MVNPNDEPRTGSADPAKASASRREPPVIEAKAQDVSGPTATAEPEPERAAPPSEKKSATASAALASGGLALAALAVAGASWVWRPADPALEEAQASLAALKTRLAQLEARPAWDGAAVAALDKRLATVESAAQTAAAASTAARAAAEAAQNEARKAQETPRVVEQQPAAPPVDLSPLDTRLAALEKRVPALETAVSRPKTDARALDAREVDPTPASQPAAVAVVAEALARAVERGAPYEAELAAMRRLGAPADKLAPLEPHAAKGVASVASLVAGLKAAAPAMAAAAQPKPASAVPAAPEPAAQGYWDAALSRLAGFVRIRKVGDPAPARLDLSSIETALAKGDVEGALALREKLPEPARLASQDWAQAASTRIALARAARGLQADAIAALSKPK